MTKMLKLADKCFKMPCVKQKNNQQSEETTYGMKKICNVYIAMYMFDKASVSWMYKKLKQLHCKKINNPI